jgi:hypothetical protein
VKRIFVVVLVLISLKVISQTELSKEISEYFQQQVYYTISVSLNDQQHTLSAYEEIEYINNSNDTLYYIYFHLWPNAYKNNSTCLAKQFLQLGEKDFYFSKPEERGFIDSLNFQINGQSCKWQINKDTIDIAIVYLNQPLPPKQSIKISTPFFVKIPSAKFSRLGHLGNAYYITQWYPKPAVYDRYGWHPIPYLHNGEFYSEYGNFDVRITLPKNYVLAATGNRLADDEEEKFMQEKIRLTKRIIDQKLDTTLTTKFPESSKEYKTVRFVESNIHDFAWFADKRFLVLSDQIQLFESNKKVNTYLYFLPTNIHLWKNALEYINDATLFYSYYVGDYPYNNVSAVDGSTAAGGGMEYPTITLINESSNPKQLEETIVHEVGHNWFYGILGSNERDYPAMDEGMNSFYEMRYLYKKYPDLKLSEVLGISKGKKLLGLEKIPQRKYYEWAYLILASHNADLPLLEHSTKYTELNYGGIVYCKTALVVEYLKNYFGEELFDEAMAFYFKTFKFKHPYPQDLRFLLNYFGGGDNIPLITTLTTTNKHIDYKLQKIKKNDNNVYEVTIKNKGNAVVPIVVQAVKDNKVIAEVWKNNIEKKETFSFPPLEADYFRIDYNEIIPDINRRNNTIKTRGLFKKTEPLQLNFSWHIDDFYKTQLHFSPMTGWNYNDGNLLGMAFYNYGIFPKKIEGYIMPMYAFKSNTLVGSADVYYNIFPEKSPFKLAQIGIAGKTYSFRSSENFQVTMSQYVKIEPYINFVFKQKNPIKHNRNTLIIRHISLFNRDNTSNLSFNNGSINWMNEIAYTYQKKSTLNPYQVQIKLQHNNLMAKSFLTFSGKTYVNKNKFFEYRLFRGMFILGNDNDKTPYAFRPSGYNSSQDYLRDNYFLSGYQDDFSYSFLGDFLKQQYVESEGNMKIINSHYSTNGITAINLYSPSYANFRLFADIVFLDEYFDKKRNYSNYFDLDAGINFSLGNFGNIYLPIFYYGNVSLGPNTKWYNLIRYSINLHRINPRFEATKNIE